MFGKKLKRVHNPQPTQVSRGYVDNNGYTDRFNKELDKFLGNDPMTLEDYNTLELVPDKNGNYTRLVTKAEAKEMGLQPGAMEIDDPFDFL